MYELFNNNNHDKNNTSIYSVLDVPGTYYMGCILLITHKIQIKQSSYLFPVSIKLQSGTLWQRTGAGCFTQEFLCDRVVATVLVQGSLHRRFFKTQVYMYVESP